MWPYRASTFYLKAHHNKIVGCDAFHKTVDTIRRLPAAGVPTSVQTTVVKGSLDVVPWVIRFCQDNQVRGVSFMPFIPRGRGRQRRVEFELSPGESRELRDLIKKNGRENAGRLDIRLLDFSARPIHVVEPDGRIVLEDATEAGDIVLYQLLPGACGAGPGAKKPKTCFAFSVADGD